MNRMLLLAAAFATFTAGAALPSQAGYPEPHPVAAPQYHGGYPYPGYPGYDEDDDDYYYEKISCWEGRREVRRAGFRNVRALRCSGDTYRYNAIRRGHNWTVRVDAWSGRILSARPVRYY